MGVTRAALWLRVSTDDQTTENQRRDLMRLADHRGYDVVTEFDISGVSAARGAHQRYVTQVVKESREFGFTVLLIWSLDRLSRRASQGPCRSSSASVQPA